MRFPTVFLNHGGGPLPLLGKQPAIVNHVKDAATRLPPEPPKAIVVISAHWESDPIKITSSPNPAMYFDYYNFPPHTYEYDYPAPGQPQLAKEIQSLLQGKGLKAELDDKRGFDHGVFVPLMLMYPKADIPVVCVSLHSSLSPQINWDIGSALVPLRDKGVLILGSGYTFHNMHALFNPSKESKDASTSFNEWLKEAVLSSDAKASLLEWAKAPGARTAHPREEHLIPLLVTAAAGGPNSTANLIYDVAASSDEFAISSYMFN